MTSPLKKPRREEAEALGVKLPEHLIFYRILPLLPFKTLCRFKSVAQTWHRLISDDSLFALHQSRHVSPMSSGMVFAGCHGDNLTFLPTFGSPIGAPHLPLQCRRVLASANGLLCLEYRHGYVHTYRERPYLYVCNPATMDGHFVTEHDKPIDSVGLAFDPATSPDRYKLVHPVRQNVLVNGSPTVEYGFEVFSSNTSKWVESRQRVKGITSTRPNGKPVFVSGVLYWDCDDYLLSFHPGKDLAGYIPLPKHRQPTRFHQEIGACDGHVTCTRLDSKSMEVWMTSAGREGWESKYSVSMDEAMEANRDVFSCFCCVMKMSSACRSPSQILFYGHDVWPLPFGGGDRLYFRISPPKGKQKAKPVVLSYDLKTGKVEKLCQIQPVIEISFRYQRMFLYHNSMVRLPKLSG